MVVSTGLRRQVAKGLAVLRRVVVGPLDESQWVSVKFESEFQWKILVISGRSTIKVSFNASQTLISNSTGLGQCVAGILARFCKILAGFQ